MISSTYPINMSKNDKILPMKITNEETMDKKTKETVVESVKEITKNAFDVYLQDGFSVSEYEFYEALIKAGIEYLNDSRRKEEKDW